MSKEYHTEIDVAKGVAMILVVAGHLVSGEFFELYPIYTEIRKIFYTFHLPVFYFFSGMTFCITYSKSFGYLDFIKKKAFRLIIPFVIFSVIIFLGKYVAEKSGLYVPNGVEDINDFFKIYLYPNESIAEYLWFIYVLLLFYMTSPGILWLLKSRYLLFVPFILVFLLPDTNFMAISKYRTYLIYFLLGYCSYYKYNFYTIYLDRLGWMFALLFCFEIFFSNRVPSLVIALTAIVAIHYLSRISLFRNLKFLSHVGRNSFSIYLWHLPFIGLLSALIIRWNNTFDLNLFYLSLVFIVGLVAPLILKHQLVKRYSFFQYLFG